MYCGDETGAFVGDCGHATSRFGYGGEDTPKLVIPSQIGVVGTMQEGESKKDKYAIGYPALSKPRDDFHCLPVYDSRSQLRQLSSPSLEKELSANPSYEGKDGLDINGENVNWDVWEELWEYAFEKLSVRNSAKNAGIVNDFSITHPVLVVEQSGFDTINLKHREIITEIMFEKFDVPSMYIMPSASLSAFSIGKQNALVIDCGASGCRATPVIDGLVLKGAQRYNNRGGDWFSDQVYEKLITKGFKVEPRYHHRSWFGTEQDSKREQAIASSVTRSFQLNALRELIYEFKSSHCGLYPTKIPQENVQNAVKNHLAQPGYEHLKEFKLPDGTIVDVMYDHPDLFLLPDIFFDEEVQHPPTSDKSKNYLDASLQKLAYDALSATDLDARKELCNNMLLTGASSQIKGFDNRLGTEMVALLPSNYRCRVISPKHTVEKLYSSWIGGSILTSLGSFQQLWLSKMQYEDYGVTLSSRKYKC